MNEDGLIRLNTASPGEAFEWLHACCGSTNWAKEMVVARPFRTRDALMATSGTVWSTASTEDRLEAFSAHPKIGDVEALRSKFSQDQWAGAEQSGTAGAPEEVLEVLAQANQAYEDRFGFIFIICATGQTAEAMLAALKSRLPRSPAVELEEASRQQSMITGIRLDKLLDS